MLQGAHIAETVSLTPTVLAQRLTRPHCAGGGGSLATTWVAGSEPLQLSLPMSYPNRIELVPGYAIDARRWARNRRPLRVKIRLSQLGSNEEWAPWWEHELDTPDELPDPPYATLELPDRSTGADAMQIAVVEATPGGPGIDDDVCISDIRVFGRIFSDQSMGDVWVDATHSPRPDLDTSGTIREINPCLSLIDGEPLYREGCVQQY